MDSSEIDRILKHMLADFRLSRGEKRVLGGIVDELAGDEDQLAFVRHRAFAIARDELIGPDGVHVVDWLEDVVKALQPKTSPDASDAEVLFSPADDCAEKIVGLLRSTRQTVDICVFTITDDRISDTIVDALERRVAIRIITDHEKADDLGSDIVRLRRVGVPVRVDRTEYHMHHKFALFDNRRVLTGSYNWTRSASTNNEENFLVSDDRRLVKAYAAEFERLWKKLGDGG